MEGNNGTTGRAAVRRKIKPSTGETVAAPDPFEIASAMYPRWADERRTAIHCMVVFPNHPLLSGAPVPFLAHPGDPEQHGQQLYRDLKAGRYGDVAPYAAVAHTPAAQYDAAIAAGLAVTCASNPALDAIYSVTDADLTGINAEAQFIGLHREFTSGEKTLSWPDAQGQLHTFADRKQFMSFAKAAARYVAACRQALRALNDGTPAAFPSNAASI
jgi:hypothetical protein